MKTKEKASKSDTTMGGNEAVEELKKQTNRQHWQQSCLAMARKAKDQNWEGCRKRRVNHLMGHRQDCWKKKGEEEIGNGCCSKGRFLEL